MAASIGALTRPLTFSGVRATREAQALDSLALPPLMVARRPARVLFDPSDENASWAGGRREATHETRDAPAASLNEAVPALPPVGMGALVAVEVLRMVGECLGRSLRRLAGH